ncbi:hypothetical protein [Bdellovibrio svalbardensis]|uniref:Uncharacterized protein n=1 Tax=Bdellovibrio svalbardensis TaxID=2972972 RepID=A0ABT6DEY6_9BACT|nr:hypothetical protein [Bdellovibrio svalbardensis]MDG0815391.1 hypothetical protein [Bdellovibrio svalbardensis]
MKIAQHVLSLTLSSGLLLSPILPAHAGGLDFLEPSKVATKVKNLIAKQRVGGTINIVDAPVYDGLSAALKYKIQSEPSYVDGFYTRLDKYTLDVNANPGDFIDGNDLPLGFSIDNKSEIIFARQFRKQSESLTALPYGPRNLPLSAEQAIRNLNPGDFVAITGKLSFVVSLGTDSPFSAIGSAGASTHAFVSGEFLIHTFRMPNNKLRVKLIALRGKGVGADGSVTLGNFKIVGFKYLDKRIKSWIDLDPLSLGLGKSSNHLFMLDYVFDLNNSQAAQAYDTLIQKKTRFKDLAFINPLEKSKSVQDDLLTDLSTVEEIAREDHELEPFKRRIDRIFKGSNDSLSTSSSFKFGLNILRFESGSTYAQNKVVHVDRDDTEQKYILDSYQTKKQINVIFGLFGDETRISSNMLFSADDNWVIRDFVALTLGREVKMKNVSKGDYKDIQEHVKSVIPASEYARIDWKKWDFSDGNRVNGYFRNELFFHPQAIRAIPKLDYPLAKVRFYNFIKTHGRPKAPPRDEDPFADSQQRMLGLDRYERDIENVAKALTLIFDPAKPSAERYNAFKNLKDHPLWQQYGGGFLMSLIPANQLNSLIAYEMTFSAKDVPTISYRFGNFEQEELYKSLMYIQRVISDRSFDLRLLTDETGEFKVY